MKKMILTAIAVMMSALLMNVKAQVKIGDVMEKSGTKGIVVYVDESGQHGLLMSVKCVPKKQKAWCEKEYAKEIIKATDENDGKKNTQAVIDFATKKGVALSKSFPLFDWVVNKCGEGWYIPAINELLTMAKGLNNGQLNGYRLKDDQVKAFEKKLKKAKGESLWFDNTIPAILSSTEGKRDSQGNGTCYELWFENDYGSNGKAIGRGIASGLVGTSLHPGKGNFTTKITNKHEFMAMGKGFSRAFYKF